jgi:hypothetical protein
MSNTDTGYAILLETFEGDKANTRAARRAKQLLEEAKISDIWIRQAMSKWQVLRGHYPDPNVERAQSDLRQVRMAQVDGLRPYENVDVVSLRLGVDSALAKFDLKQFAGHALYSLQVAAFDEAYGENFRQAAEDYMRELRDAGEEAYFYHAPEMSMVTIGIFSNEDLPLRKVKRQMPDGQISEFKQTAYGPRILEIQQRHPHNIFNGYTVSEKLPSGVRDQPSMVIAIQ